MNWMDTYIRLCLARVPHSGFRRRAAAELADHLELLAADLKAGGLSPQQARAAALERMGDPQVLARNYEAVWQHRARSPRYSSPRIGLGCILTGLVYLLTLTALGALGVTYDASPGMPMIGNSFLSALVGCALFLIPFSSGGILLFHLLRGCPHLGRLITAGLLLAWAGEKAAVLSLSSLCGNWALCLPGSAGQATPPPPGLLPPISCSHWRAVCSHVSWQPLRRPAAAPLFNLSRQNFHTWTPDFPLS